MTVESLDEHLEGLRDRELAGTLTEEERAVLEAHVASCDACQKEGRLRAAAIAEPDDSRDWGAFFEKIEPELELPVGSQDDSGRSPAWGVLLRVAIVLLVLGSTGVVLAATVPAIGRIFGLVDPAPSDETPSEVAPSKAPRRPREVRPREALPIDEPPAEEPRVEEPPVEEPPVEEPPVEEPPVEENVEEINEAPQETEQITIRERESPADSPRPPETPRTDRTLYQEAAAARRAGNRTEARRLFEALIAEFPGSSRATAAHFALGELYRGSSASQALTHYDAYLASGARGLREEALLGRARSLQRLGRSSPAAWEQLLREYPTTPHRAEAVRALDR
ncbi:MAG: tetratricopeptide repeat protein [Myxococcota bacterium]